MKRSYIVCGLILIAGCGKKSAEEPAGEAQAAPIAVETAIAKIESIRELVPVDGSFVLSPGDFAKLAPATAGKLLAVNVNAGDRVRKGQLLAKIDTTVLDAQRASASTGAAVAKAQAAQNEASLRASSADYKAAIQSAQLNLEAVISDSQAAVTQAQIELDKLKAGARPQELAQAEQAVRQAQVNRDKASADAERDQKLLEQGYVSGQQADASRAAFQVAESALLQAKSQLALTKEGARPEDLRAAQARLKSAKETGQKHIQAARASLEQAKQGNLAIAAKIKEAEAARLGASQKSSDAAAAIGLAATGEIRAPFDGVVVRRSLGPGDSADATTPVLEVAKLGARVEFSGQVAASVASKLLEGMAALSGDSRDVSGVVRSVGVGDVQSGFVPVRIAFAKPAEAVSAGTFARVYVVIRRVTDAVVVPEQAVLTREDKQVVFVVSQGVAKMTEVSVGPTENGRVAIVHGVKAGDKVILVGQHELSDGAKVEESPKEGGK